QRGSFGCLPDERRACSISAPRRITSRPAQRSCPTSPGESASFFGPFRLQGSLGLEPDSAVAGSLWRIPRFCTKRCGLPMRFAPTPARPLLGSSPHFSDYFHFAQKKRGNSSAHGVKSRSREKP